MKRVFVFVGLKVLEVWFAVSIWLILSAVGQGFVSVVWPLKTWASVEMWFILPFLTVLSGFAVFLTIWGLRDIVIGNWVWSRQLISGESKAFTIHRSNDR